MVLAFVDLASLRAKESKAPESRVLGDLGLENEKSFFENLESNLDYQMFGDFSDFSKVLRRYHRSRARYRTYVLRALRGKDRERQVRALTLIGLLRLPDFVEASVALAQREPGDATLQEGVAFYLHRIGRESEKNLGVLIAGFSRLFDRPSDDWVVFWSGFVDSPEPARSLLQKLREKADGAAGELVRDARTILSLRCPEHLIPPTCRKDPWL